MRIRFICRYCGLDWVAYLYEGQDPDEVKCQRCGDRDLKTIDDEKRNVFGY